MGHKETGSPWYTDRLLKGACSISFFQISRIHFAYIVDLKHALIIDVSKLIYSNYDYFANVNYRKKW